MRSWTSAQHSLTFYSWISFAKCLHGKRTYFALCSSSPWEPCSCWDLNLCSENLSTPNWRAASKSFEVHLKLGWLTGFSPVLISQIQFLLILFINWVAHSKSPKIARSHFFMPNTRLLHGAPIAVQGCMDSFGGAIGQMRCCGAMKRQQWGLLIEGKIFFCVPQKISGNKIELQNCFSNCGFCCWEKNWGATLSKGMKQ